jgi:dATP pyrophosphohydrolase
VETQSLGSAVNVLLMQNEAFYSNLNQTLCLSHQFEFNENSVIFLKKRESGLAIIINQIIEVCIFRWIAGEPQYLLLQRADDEELYPGIWQIVTGSMKQNESTDKAALRELEEETGLRVKRFWTVPFVDSYFDIRNDVVHIVPVFAAEVETMLNVRLSHEHQRFEWLSYAAGRARVVWPGQRYAIDTVHEYIAGGKEAARLLEIKQF